MAGWMWKHARNSFTIVVLDHRRVRPIATDTIAGKVTILTGVFFARRGFAIAKKNNNNTHTEKRIKYHHTHQDSTSEQVQHTSTPHTAIPAIAHGTDSHSSQVG